MNEIGNKNENKHRRLAPFSLIGLRGLATQLATNPGLVDLLRHISQAASRPPTLLALNLDGAGAAVIALFLESGQFSNKREAPYK